MTSAQWLTVVITLGTWLTPSPEHAAGRLVLYGGQGLVEANADWHGYDLAPYRDRCGVSAISPADLGKVFWVRTPGGAWYGLCLSVDVAARNDFAWIVYYADEVAEVARPQADVLGFEKGIMGEVFIGLCPPMGDGAPKPYAPPIEIDTLQPAREYSLYPYPPQQLPISCIESKIYGEHK